MHQLLINSLASYRLTRLITKESGPMDAFHWLRSWVGVYDVGADGRPITTTGKLFDCPYCTGIWVALFFTFLPNHKYIKWFKLWLAIAGIQTVLQSHTEIE